MARSISIRKLSGALREEPTSSPGVGVGEAIAHHGEIIQGAFPDQNERLHRALVTLPLFGWTARTTFWPGRASTIETRPADRPKSAIAARLTLDALGFSNLTGSLIIDSTIPHSRGLGSSTADVVSTIRAVVSSVQEQLSRSSICQIAVAAEAAIDAIAFDEQPVLFAHREGRVLEYLAGDLPPFLVVGFASPDDAPVDTVDFEPARYVPEEIEAFRVLRGMLRRAIRTQDPTLLGAVSTESARINQRRLPKSRLEEVEWLSRTEGGCGVQVAHSGNRMGILIDARTPDAEVRAASIARYINSAGFEDFLCFGINAGLRGRRPS